MSQSRPVIATSAEGAQLEARQRIINAAFRLFGEKGYSCTSVQDIADVAGVQKSILYYYFASKEGLYQTLCTESAKNLRTFMLQSLTDTGLPLSSQEGEWRVELPENVSCKALLSALVEKLIALARDNREPVRFFLAHTFAPDGDRPPVSVHEMEHITPHIIQHVGRAALKRGEISGEIEDLERLILGSVHYSIIRYLRSPKDEPLKPGLGARIVSAALRGFQPMDKTQ